MPPVPATSLNLDDDQRFALMKFRRSVQDVCTRPEHNDYFLLRWLKARSWNAEAAEKMLRDSLTWREKWAIDTQLPLWEPQEPLISYFPSGITGFDKEGAPVMILPFAGLDLWGLLHSVSKSDMIRMVIRVLEAYLKIAEQQSQARGPNARQLLCIMDMEGFSMRQYAWRPAGELVISLLQMYESNYPEILKTCYIINVIVSVTRSSSTRTSFFFAPKVFSLAFSIVKKFVNEMTIRKIVIYNSDRRKWESAILNVVDTDQVPKHYGGTQVDPDGNPRCPSKVKVGGKVPKHYHTRKMNEEKKASYTNVTIKSGEKHSVDLICAEPGCFLRWEFGVEDHDIKFLVLNLDDNGKETVAIGPRKISGNVLETGLISVNGPSTYTVIFDNTSSFLRNKNVYYNVSITPPLSKLDISTAPAEDDCPTSTGVIAAQS